MDPVTTLVGLAIGVAAQVAPAPVPVRTKDPAASGATPSPSPPTGHRLRLVRATDRTPIGGAELFDVEGGGDGALPHVRRAVEHADEEFPKLANRLVADGDGFVTLGPSRWHAFLARAPGWFELVELFDFARARSDTVELFPDDPLTIELKDARGAGVAGILVEMGQFFMCGSGPNYNATWRVASDSLGRVSLPHYRWWVSGDEFGGDRWLAPQIPLAKAQILDLRKIPFDSFHVLPDLTTGVTWEIPPLSKVRVEFDGAETLPANRPITFELVGPNGLFGIPDRYASDHGRSVEVPCEAGVPLRAQFHWSEPDAKLPPKPNRFAYGDSPTREGATARLRVALANDPVEILVRPVHGDGATASGRFDAVVGWNDSRGFRWNGVVDSLTADATGVLRFTWQRPRLADDERPPAIHVALRRHVDLWGWEPLEVPEDAARDLAWPATAELDVGTLIVPSAK